MAILFQKPAVDVFSGVDGGGNARRVINGDVQTWGTAVERGLNNYHATVASLDAMDPAAQTHAFVLEAPYDGIWAWVSGNQSANVSADKLGFEWRAPASAPDGTGGAWRIQRDNRPGFFAATGQSNMISLLTAAGGPKAVLPGTFVWNPQTDAFQVIDLANTITLDSNNGGLGSVGSIGGGRNNMAVAAIQEWSRRTGRPAVLVIEALGAQSLDAGWLGGTPTIYPYHKANLDKAVAALGGTRTLDAMFFHQGEGDYGISTGKSAYWSKLGDLLTLYRSNSWWGLNTKFIAGEIALRVAAENTQLQRLNDGEYYNTGCVSSVGLTLVDSVHFDGDSVYAMGMRMVDMLMGIPEGNVATAGRGGYVANLNSATLKGTTTDPTVTGGSMSGQIVQQGAIVHIKGSYSWTSFTGGSGFIRLEIPSMPAARGGALDVVGLGITSGFSSGSPAYAAPVGGASQFSFRSAAGTQLSISNLNGGGAGSISFGGEYLTDVL